MTDYVGCNIYFWGEREQDRLIAECVRPLAEGLSAEGARRSIFCDRFDTRGPHVMALFGVTAEDREEVAARVGEAVSEYLRRSPSAVEIGAPELEARHAACRGAALAAIDRDPGIAPNNSYRLFDHTERDYPFALAEGSADRDEIRRLRDDVVYWALAQIGGASPGSAMAAAIRWLAAVDRALRAAREDVRAHFRYLSGRLLHGVDKITGLAAATAARIQAMIGERNRTTLARVWRGASGGQEGGAGLERLVRLALADDGRPLAARRELFYDLVHATLLLLGLTALQQAPLFLFAWAESEIEGAAAEGTGSP